MAGRIADVAIIKSGVARLNDHGIKGGMGRHSSGHKLHTEKAQCGPCYICHDNHPSLRYSHFHDSQDDFHDWAMNLNNIDCYQCICKKCILKLYREFSQTQGSDQPSPKQPKLMCILNKFSTCYEPCERFLKLSQLDLLSQCFNIHNGLLADEPKLPICKSHNL